MRDTLPIKLIVAGVIAGVLIMFWAIYATHNSEVGKPLPPADVAGGAAPAPR